MTRGIKHQRDLFVSMLQSQFFEWKRTNLSTNQEEMSVVQGSLRPIELWEYVFPEESLNDVCTAIGIQGDHSNGANLGLSSQAKIVLLRKMLGAKKIPDITPENKRVIPLVGMSVHPIGIKEDVKGNMYNYRQEFL